MIGEFGAIKTQIKFKVIVLFTNSTQHEPIEECIPFLIIYYILKFYMKITSNQMTSSQTFLIPSSKIGHFVIQLWSLKQLLRNMNKTYLKDTFLITLVKSFSMLCQDPQTNIICIPNHTLCIHKTYWDIFALNFQMISRIRK